MSRGKSAWDIAGAEEREREGRGREREYFNCAYLKPGM